MTTVASDEHQVYLNSTFVPRSQATLDIEDRGAMFADGVYEVVRYYAGRPFAMRQHLSRLRTSLEAIQLPEPYQIGQLDGISDELVRRNNLPDASVYWQVTRGSSPRRHVIPTEVQPTVLAIAYPASPLDPAAKMMTLSAILADDLRWHGCSIKSLMLLPNVLAKSLARDAGADEAILHRDGQVTEGTATSVFMVTQGQLWTHRADQWILGGITRQAVLELAHQAGIPTFERTFTTNQLLGADEVLICGTSTLMAAVARIDGHSIGNGKAGLISTHLHRLLVEHVSRACGFKATS